MINPYNWRSTELKSISQSILLWILATVLLSSSSASAELNTELKSRPHLGRFLIYETSSGFFATVLSVIGALDFYEKGSYSGFQVKMSGGVYLDPELGPNWWNYFFEPINFGNHKARHHVFTVEEHGKFVGKANGMDRAKANYFIQKYIHVLPHIQHQVDEFVSEYFGDAFVIGVHHRGTDKVIEMPRVPFERTNSALQGLIDTLDENQKITFKIYVATDDAGFLEFMKEQYGDRVLYNQFVRTTDDTPLHYGNDDKYSSIYKKGEEALIDGLLLSRCNHLIRPNSSLSIASGLFNPTLPVTILSGN